MLWWSSHYLPRHTSPIGLCRGLAVNASGDLFIAGSAIFMVNGPNTTATDAGLSFGYGSGIIHSVAGGGTNSFAGPYNQLASIGAVAFPDRPRVVNRAYGDLS